MKKLLPPFFFLIIIAGCNINDLDFDNLEPPVLDGTFAIPVGHVHYTMRELIDSIGDQNLDLTEDSTSLLMLTYRDTANFGSGNELVTVDDITNTGTIFLNSESNNTSSPIQITYDSTFIFTYPAENNEKIDSVFYQEGALRLNITKQFEHEVIYDVTIQNTRTENGDVPVNLTGTVPATQESASTSQDLSDYKTVLSFQDNENTFEFSVTLGVVLGPGESISSNDYVVFNLVYEDQTFDLLFGRFGQDTTNIGNQVIDVDFFADLGDSGLEFGSPEITFDFRNSFGVPLGVRFGGMYGVNGDSIAADTTYLQGDITNTPQVIDGAANIGERAASTIVVNRNNSSIQDLLSQSPNQIGFDLSAISNPSDPNGNNFILDESNVTTYIELFMPLEISLKNVTREFNFDLGDGLKFNEADSLSLRLISENGLPFSALLEFEIINDSTEEVTYQVPNTLVLETAFINPSGIVSQSRKNVADIPVGQDGVAALNAGGNLRLRFTLNTPGVSGDTFIKVLADYALNIQLSVVGKLNYQP